MPIQYFDFERCFGFFRFLSGLKFIVHFTIFTFQTYDKGVWTDQRCTMTSHDGDDQLTSTTHLAFFCFFSHVKKCYP